MKFIHCADVHLDAPFALYDPKDAKMRRDTLRNAFSALVDTAKTEDCAAFLIAGDLFDDDTVTKDTFEQLLDLFASLPSCTFVISPGNHDPYYEKSPYALLTFPDNVHIFRSKEMAYADIPDTDARVYGYAFTSRTFTSSPLAAFRVHDENRLNLLCAHGDVGAPLSVYAPISEKELAASGADYAALGHIHKASGLKYAGDTAFAYCGCPVGRGFDETGAKSAYLCDVQKGAVSITPVYPSPYRYEIVRLDVTGAAAMADVLPLVSETVLPFDEHTALRLLFEGVTAPSFSLDERMMKNLVSRPFLLDVRDGTVPLWGEDALKNDETVVGRFYRIIEPHLSAADEKEREKAHLALKFGLKALNGQELC